MAEILNISALAPWLCVPLFQAVCPCSFIYARLPAPGLQMVPLYAYARSQALFGPLVQVHAGGDRMSIAHTAK